MESVVTRALICNCCNLFVWGLVLLYLRRQVQWKKFAAFFRSLSRLGGAEETEESLLWRVWKETKEEQIHPLGFLLPGVSAAFSFLIAGPFTGILLAPVLVGFGLLLSQGVKFLANVIKAYDDRCARGLDLVRKALEEGTKLSLPVEPEAPAPTPLPSVEERVAAQWALLEKYLAEHASRQHITLSLNDVDENNPLFEVNVRKLEQERNFFPHKGHCRSGCDSKGEICLILNKKPVECVLF